jgi:hypothetical protein
VATPSSNSDSDTTSDIDNSNGSSDERLCAPERRLLEVTGDKKATEYDLRVAIREAAPRINVRDPGTGMTPLHISLTTERPKDFCLFAELLLKAGADPFVEDNGGRTCVELAKRTNRPAVVDLVEKAAQRVEKGKPAVRGVNRCPISQRASIVLAVLLASCLVASWVILLVIGSLMLSPSGALSYGNFWKSASWCHDGPDSTSANLQAGNQVSLNVSTVYRCEYGPQRNGRRSSRSCGRYMRYPVFEIPILAQRRDVDFGGEALVTDRQQAILAPGEGSWESYSFTRDIASDGKVDLSALTPEMESGDAVLSALQLTATLSPMDTTSFNLPIVADRVDTRENPGSDLAFGDVYVHGASFSNSTSGEWLTDFKVCASFYEDDRAGTIACGAILIVLFIIWPCLAGFAWFYLVMEMRHRF